MDLFMWDFHDIFLPNMTLKCFTSWAYNGPSYSVVICLLRPNARITIACVYSLEFL